MVVGNDYKQNCDDLKMTRDGIARHENVKEMMIVVSKEKLLKMLKAVCILHLIWVTIPVILLMTMLYMKENITTFPQN